MRSSVSKSARRGHGLSVTSSCWQRRPNSRSVLYAVLQAGQPPLADSIPMQQKVHAGPERAANWARQSSWAWGGSN